MRLAHALVACLLLLAAGAVSAQVMNRATQEPRGLRKSSGSDSAPPPVADSPSNPFEKGLAPRPRGGLSGPPAPGEVIVTCPDRLEVGLDDLRPAPGWTSKRFPGSMLHLYAIGVSLGPEGAMLSSIRCVYGRKPQSPNSTSPIASIEKRIHFTGEKFWCERKGPNAARCRSK